MPKVDTAQMYRGLRELRIYVGVPPYQGAYSMVIKPEIISAAIRHNHHHDQIEELLRVWDLLCLPVADTISGIDVKGRRQNTITELVSLLGQLNELPENLNAFHGGRYQHAPKEIMGSSSSRQKLLEAIKENQLG